MTRTFRPWGMKPQGRSVRLHHCLFPCTNYCPQLYDSRNLMTALSNKNQEVIFTLSWDFNSIILQTDGDLASLPCLEALLMHSHGHWTFDSGKSKEKHNFKWKVKWKRRNCPAVENQLRFMTFKICLRFCGIFSRFCQSCTSHFISSFPFPSVNFVQNTLSGKNMIEFVAWPGCFICTGKNQHSPRWSRWLFLLVHTIFRWLHNMSWTTGARGNWKLVTCFERTCTSYLTFRCLKDTYLVEQHLVVVEGNQLGARRGFKAKQVLRLLSIRRMSKHNNKWKCTSLKRAGIEGLYILVCCCLSFWRNMYRRSAFLQGPD